MTATVKGEPRTGATYRPGGGWDEASHPDGRPRDGYASLMDALQGVDLSRLDEDVSARLADAGVTFGGAPSTFRVDPVPRIFGAEEWAGIEAGVAQRARALAAFVCDVYADRAIVQAGRVPAHAIESAEHFEPWMVGVAMPSTGFVAGLDLVRGHDGHLRVLEDNTRTPSGLAYLLAARAAVDAHLPVAPPAARREPAAAYEMLGEMLRAAAPDGVSDPYVGLLSDGPANNAWWEHRQVARALGIHLVTPSSLLVRRGRLHAVADSGKTYPIDVLYRRTDEDRLRGPNGRATWLADLLLAPVRRGNLTVVNPFGAGVADDKLIHAYVGEMVRFYLGEEPLLRSVHTYDLGDPEVRKSVMPRLDELVVKPRSGLGGYGVVVCPHASEADRREVVRRANAAPHAWVAQEMVALSTHPTVCDGRLEPRHVDLRPYAMGGATHATTVPGALTRVAFDRGSLVVNSSQNGGAKDTWGLA